MPLKGEEIKKRLPIKILFSFHIKKIHSCYLQCILPTLKVSFHELPQLNIHTVISFFLFKGGLLCVTVLAVQQVTL